jgi:hypothetical protein
MVAEQELHRVTVLGNSGDNMEIPLEQPDLREHGFIEFTPIPIDHRADIPGIGVRNVSSVEPARGPKPAEQTQNCFAGRGLFAPAPQRAGATAQDWIGREMLAALHGWAGDLQIPVTSNQVK